MSKLDDFGGDEALAAEYSDVKECPKSDLGYHCSCYDRGQPCDICEQEPPKKPNYYRGPVRAVSSWAPISDDKPSIKK